MQNSKSKEFGS